MAFPTVVASISTFPAKLVVSPNAVLPIGSAPKSESCHYDRSMPSFFLRQLAGSFIAMISDLQGLNSSDIVPNFSFEKSGHDAREMRKQLFLLRTNVRKIGAGDLRKVCSVLNHRPSPCLWIGFPPL